MKTLFSRVLLVSVSLTVGACAANNYCTGVQPYEKAKSVPALKPAGDLKLPESAAALKIPPPAARPVAYGEAVKDKDGDTEIHCLDKPPEMAPIAEAKPAPLSAPAAAPAAPPAPATEKPNS